MAEKRLLIADADARTWEEFRQALGHSWVVAGAETSEAALKTAEEKPFDVVVANADLPGFGGAELLNRLRVAHPKTVRFIAAPEALKDKVMHNVLGGDQFLAIPFNRAAINLLIDRAVVTDYGMSNSVRELVSRIRTFPTIPSLYLEVINALQDPKASTADIGEIISRDMSMTTKLVQVLNSAYFGLPRTVTDPTEAVGILGFETVKSLVMTVKLLSQYDKLKPVYFSIDNVWRHSTNVARTARVMALLETGGVEASATAYTAGLMHDLGKVILAANFDSQYHGAHSLARKQQIPLWEVEKDIFGATHGEIGAYLLSLWGMSDEVVRVASLHHYPIRSGDKDFTALTAVHVANALEYEGVTETDGLPSPVVDSAYLQSLNLEDRVELWRMARREPNPPKAETTTVSPGAITTTPKQQPTQVAKPARRQFNYDAMWKWLALGTGVIAAFALAVSWEVKKIESFSAKTPPPAEQQVAEVITPNQTTATPNPTPAPEVRPAPVAAPVAPPKPAPPKTGFDRIKLQAIFYSSTHPTALINGRLAEVNELVADCRVLDIQPTSITLEYKKQQKTLTLR